MVNPEEVLLDMCCGGRRRCPVLKRRAGGGFALEDEGHRVELSDDQALAVARRLLSELERAPACVPELHSDVG